MKKMYIIGALCIAIPLIIAPFMKPGTVMKKVVIFTSPGGGGHMAATQAITSYLSHDYAVKPVCIFSEVLHSIEPTAVITGNTYNGEQVYNFCMQRKWFWALNGMYHLGSLYFDLQKKKIQELITDYLSKEDPDAIISVVPMVNNFILKAAQDLNIPFLVIPTDLDIRTFVQDIKNPAYDYFRFSLPFDQPAVTKNIESADIPQEHIVSLGFPIRANFFIPKNLPAIKEDFAIPKDKPIVLIMTGAVGSEATYRFTKELARSPIPLHIIACVGRNERMKKQLGYIKCDPLVSVSIVGFTQRIADLMAVADLLVTKSGSVSVCEAIYSNLPMVLDATSTVLRWEKLNHQFIADNGFGTILHNYRDTLPIVTNLLTQQHELAAMRNRLTLLPKVNPEIEIKRAIHEIITQKETKATQ